MTEQNRVLKGIPTGGQFAPDTHAESPVALAPASGQPHRDQIAGDWTNFSNARDAMAQSAMDSLADSVDREFGEGSSVFLEVDPEQPSWMRVTGVRTPAGGRVNNGVFQAWKFDDELDLSPSEAASYLPADDGSHWWDNAVKVSDEEPGYIGDRTGTEEWHLDLAKVRASKAAAA